MARQQQPQQGAVQFLTDAPPAADAAEDQNRVTGSRFGVGERIYELCEELGSGAAARVYACRMLRTGERFAVKVINLQRMRLMGDFEQHMIKLNREIEILRELHHERIVNLVDVYQTAGWCFLVMELVTGGELFDQIVQNRSLNEVEAKYVFRQLLEGIAYMHSRHVIHRDLKPENILIASSRPAPSPHSGKLRDVKIADFGLSKVVSDGASFAKTFVGTPQYWAPEVLEVQRGGGSYTQAADFWSLGAVLFVMLSGRYPFDGKKMPLEAQIQTAAYNMSTAAWQHISEEAKDIVRGLLKVNPAERLGLVDCLRHPWVVGTGSFAPHLPAAPCRPGPMIMEVSTGNSASAASPVPVVSQQSSHSDVGTARSASEREEAAECGSPPSSAQSARDQVPSLHVAGGVQDSPQEHETIFCLNELLKLQVSIAGSLEMACLAFRHADVELCDAIRQTFRQARDVSQHATNVVSLYAQVAQQVSQMVLPDLKLAVQEKEPSLALSLLGMVKGWVSNMKTDGEDIQRRYMNLQASVHTLIRRAQMTKKDADRRLGEAVQVVEAEVAAPPLSPRSQHLLALAAPPPPPQPSNGRTSSSSGPTTGSSADGGSPMADGDDAPPQRTSSHRGGSHGGVGSAGGHQQGGTPISLAPPTEVASGGYGGGGSGSGGSFSAGGDGSGGAYAGGPQECAGGGGSTTASLGGKEGALNVPFSMNNWTRQLFDQLTQLSDGAAGDGKKGAPAQKESAVKIREAGAGHIDEEAWKRDVLELLFMAPGVVPAHLPRLDQARVDTSRVDALFKADHEARGGASSDRGAGASAGGASTPASAGGGAGGAAEDAEGCGLTTAVSEVAMVLHVPGPNQSAKAAAEAMTHSSASLLRALRELKRVDEILQGCSAFWANMDGTVQKLAQMKEHTEILVRFAGNSNPLRERFAQRVSEYTSFWSSLDRLCRQYCMDHQAASARMYEMIREVSDAADVIDTAQSARMCLGLAPLRDAPQRRQSPVAVE